MTTKLNKTRSNMSNYPLPELYKRGSNHSIRYWSIQTEDTPAQKAHIVKRFGTFGTDSPHKSEQIVTVGKNIGKKNETTYLTQALLNAQSCWESKKKQGYYSLEDLGVICKDYSWEFEGIHYSNILKLLKQGLPYPDSFGLNSIKPMLSQGVNFDEIEYPVYVSPLIEGYRALRLSKGNFMVSAEGKPILTIDALLSRLKTLDCDLDGVLSIPGHSIESITSAIKQPQSHTRELVYYIHDVINDKPQQERMLELIAKVEPLTSSQIKIVPHKIADNYEEVQSSIDHYISDGYTGVTLRNLKGMYEQGKPSKNFMELIALAEVNNFKFLYWECGVGGLNNLKAVCQHNNLQFECKMVTNYSQNKELYYDNCKDKLVAVRHMGYTKEGIPRQAIGLSII